MTAGMVTVDCTCGNQVALPVAAHTGARDTDGILDIQVGVDFHSDHWRWHKRRFHGGKDDGPAEVAA